MSQRALVIVALSAAFGLVLIGGVVSRMSVLSEISEAATADAPPPAAAPQAGQPSETDWAGRLEARESEYRARIDEANRRLRRQQAALDEARRQLEQPSPAPREVERDESDDGDDDDDDDEDDDREDDDERQHRFAHAEGHDHDD